MPSYTKEKGGELKLTDQTENPDQAAELTKPAAKPAPATGKETETK